MKNFIALLLCSLPLIVYSQPTTQEEYNYVTKGYKVQLATGLDMKKGYTVSNVTAESLKFSNSTWTAVIKYLKRDKTGLPCAMILVLNNDTYFCIPTYDADQALWTDFLSSLNKYYTNKYSGPTLEVIAWALAKANALQFTPKG